MSVMAESSTSETKQLSENDIVHQEQINDLKNEKDVNAEIIKCLICSTNVEEKFNIYCTRTNCHNITLYNFICKFTPVNFEVKKGFSKFMCNLCYGLVNILEQAEEEYIKLKNNFESILNKNPLFDNCPLVNLNVKTEKLEVEEICQQSDSEDEPLAVTKTKRHKEKKTKTKNKKRVKKQDREIEEEETTRKTNSESLWLEMDIVPDVLPKIEFENARMDDNELENGIDYKLKEEIDSCLDDDNTQDFEPDEDEMNDNDDDDDEDEVNGDDNELMLERPKKVGRKKRKENSKKKTFLKCDQCDGKYSSPVRLARHKLNHDHSKPPYICEICGAHYKHRRACDIHIALHKGISDWKCEECNKLFPSKAALQRHNNIHTGKAIYQCDLCGKSFIHTSSFKMHKLAHTGVKAHKCATCGLSLMTRSHLQRHQRVHSGEKKHQCPLCGKRFSERYNLLAHSKSHSATDAHSPSTDAMAAVLAAAPRRRLFRCSFCEQRFERRYMLAMHMEREHQRTLETLPPRPRNTMSKLLKAQAAASTTPAEDNNIKNEPGRESNDRPQALKTQDSNGSPEGASSTRNWHTAYAVYTTYSSNT